LAQLPDDGSITGGLMRRIAWADTPLGPVERWPSSLLTALSMLRNSPHPVFIWWGKELVQFYNDACIPILGAKHPGDLGRPGREAWAEAFHLVEPAERAALVPILDPQRERVLGVFIAGLSPRRPFDDAYRDFLGLSRGWRRRWICSSGPWASTRRILDLMTTPLGVTEGGQRSLPTPLRGEVVFENVGFSYPASADGVSGLSLRLPAGTTLALDEATSAVDNETEAAIQRSLEKIAHNRTVIVIAHRLSTIVRADSIVVMDAGRVVEQGDHAALIERGGLYAAQWRVQTGLG
jgi:hypothetical protein